MNASFSAKNDVLRRRAVTARPQTPQENATAERMCSEWTSQAPGCARAAHEGPEGRRDDWQRRAYPEVLQSRGAIPTVVM
jgi:hypothetical protein